MLKDKIVQDVMNKLQQRSEIGIKKYGTTIWDNTDENYINHALEESLDLANYLQQQLRLGEFIKKVIIELEKPTDELDLGFIIKNIYNEFKNGE